MVKDLSKFDKEDLYKQLISKAVVMPNGCWTRNNYEGKEYSRLSYEDFYLPLHRVCWYVFKGSDPGSMCVCHKCDHPYCFNPDHLFIGTPQTNAADRRNKLRGGIGQKNGNSKLSSEEVREIRKKYSESLVKRGMITKMASEYNVSYDQIRNIVLNRQRNILD